MATSRAPRRSALCDDEAEAVLAACRVLVAMSARSIAAIEDAADLAEFRALVIVASRGQASLSELAEAAHIHLSRASRLCERMVAKGLIDRTDDPTNRRQLTLTLTPAGKKLVQTVMQRRRAAIDPILDRLSRHRRAELVSVLREFAAAGGEPSESDLWSMGWTT